MHRVRELDLGKDHIRGLSEIVIVIRGFILHHMIYFSEKNGLKRDLQCNKRNVTKLQYDYVANFGWKNTL